ncbi:MAG TPA: response regulator [Allosphingosinicella sp.]
MTEENELNPNFVYVVDDDRDVRRSLSFMLGASDMRSHPFGSGEDFLAAVPTLQPGCILLDLRMPEMDGFHVMSALAERDIDWPIIVMTGHGEVPVAVRAMKLGAVDFIEKPFSEEALLACFNHAFTLLNARESSGRRKRQARDRVSQLTARENEILQGLLAGESNKQIAARLGISLRTVEMHRGNMMDRLGVESLAEALALALEAGLEAAPRGDG